MSAARLPNTEGLTSMFEKTKSSFKKKLVYHYLVYEFVSFVCLHESKKRIGSEVLFLSLWLLWYLLLFLTQLLRADDIV